jgi:hypothetical protein
MAHRWINETRNIAAYPQLLPGSFWWNVRRNARNHRASLLALTDGGRERAARASAWPEFLGAAVAELAPHEQPVFLAGLLKMIRALQQAGMIPPQRMCISCVYFRAHAHAGARPHHCDLVGAPMAAAHLRIDCGEHEPASDAHADVTWQRFVAPR